MKKIILLLSFIILSVAAIAQTGSLSQSVYRSRVNDSTAAIAANVAPIAAGYSPWFWNNQATTPHWDIWNGSSYDHVFDFNSGTGSGSNAPTVIYYSIKTTNYTPIVTDTLHANVAFLMRSTGSITFTIPTHASQPFNQGTSFMVINDSTGTLDIVAASGAIDIESNVAGPWVLAENETALVSKENGTNSWRIFIGSSSSGTVTDVSGTSNRITSTGGATPVIDVSATFEALLAKRAERIDQNNAATTSAQLQTTISDESGTGALIFAGGNIAAGTATTPTTSDNDTSIPTTAMVQARAVEAYAASGTGTYTVTVSGITAYATGQIFDVIFPSTNSINNPTLNVNSLGAKSLQKHGASNFDNGAIVPNMPYRAYYDGTSIQLDRQSATRIYSVEGYGAKHDYQTVSDASITSGTDALTTSGSIFTVSDIGKTIRLSGAGAAGIDLITTIDGFTSGTSVSIATNASTTIAAKRIEWGTDDTANIQIAINDCFDRGGGTVYFPNGIYFLSGALVTSVNSVNPNAQLYIPLSNDATILKTVNIVGESSPILPRGPFADQNEPTTGVIWKSVIVGSGTVPAVIGSSFANDGFVDANKTVLHIENIAIRVNSIVGVTHSASTMSAFKLYQIAAKQVKNCYAYIESTPTLSVIPTNVTYGFWLSQQGHSDNHSEYSSLTSVGFYYGFRLEEHDKNYTLDAYTCLHAVALSGNSSGHPIGVNGTIVAQWCKYGIAILAARTVDIDYYSERWPGSFTTKWFDGVADIYIPSSVAITGRIRGSATLAGGGAANLITSGTYTGNLSIEDIKAMPVETHTLTSKSVAGSIISTSTANDGVQVVAGHATNRIGFYAQNTNAGGQATHYMENNRGSLATYGGLLLGGSTNAIGNLFGVSRADKLFIFADGASNLGMAIGTLSAQPVIFGANNAEAARIISGGQLGVGVTAPTTKLHTTAFATAYVAKTALYTLGAADYTVEVTSGTHTQTLPTAVGITGRQYVITNSGSGVVTVGTTSSQTFVNVATTPTTLTLAQFDTAIVQSNGANWLRLK